MRMVRDPVGPGAAAGTPAFDTPKDWIQRGEQKLLNCAIPSSCAWIS